MKGTRFQLRLLKGLVPLRQMNFLHPRLCFAIWNFFFMLGAFNNYMDQFYQNLTLPCPLAWTNRVILHSTYLPFVTWPPVDFLLTPSYCRRIYWNSLKASWVYIWRKKIITFLQVNKYQVCAKKLEIVNLTWFAWFWTQLVKYKWK